LLGEGCHIEIWDEKVSLGRLVGSNRQFIESMIPHIGSLLCDDMHTVIATADLVLIGTQAIVKEKVASLLRPDQKLIDLIRLEESQPRVMASPVS
jgi:GDP-mannose 6-dehydrogenase